MTSRLRSHLEQRRPGYPFSVGRTLAIYSGLMITIFLAASALCGLAQNMPELIVFRGLQGLGAGGVIPLAMATTGQIVPPRDRGRFVALISSAFLTASLLGP